MATQAGPICSNAVCRSGIWLVRSEAFITMGCLCHMAILIDGFVYEISTGGQGSLSLAGDLNWQVHASETYQSSGYSGWVRVFGHPKCMRTRQELKQYAESLAGTPYDPMLENCQHFCKKMIAYATRDMCSHFNSIEMTFTPERAYSGWRL